MRKISRCRYIYAVVLSMMTMLEVCAESFADFFVHFFYDSESQATKINYPISTPSGFTRVKSGWQTIRMKDKSNVMVVYSDSADAILTYKSVSPAVVDIKNLSGSSYFFSQYEQKNSAKVWRLSSVSLLPNTAFADKDFMSFLERFCSDKEFQKKRIIFPLKEVDYLVGKEDDEAKASRLYMPQNWQPIDFYAQYQQFCWFRTGEDSSANRQILIYENGERSALYNFIKIRSNWFLIEVSKYKTK